MSTGDPRWVEIKADPLLHAHAAGTPVPKDCEECAAKRRAMPEPVIPTPVEPHGIVVCSDNPEPHSLTGECVDPCPAEWTPGAGAALLRRERPHMVPDLTEEDRRKADEIIANARPRCPRCGETRVMHPALAVCRLCAADCGWDPRCEACIAEEKDSTVTRDDHIATCAEGMRPADRFELSRKPLTDEEVSELKGRFLEAMSHPQRMVVLPTAGDERERAAYARGISEGRRQAAPPDDVRTAAACISQDIRQAIDVLYGELAGEDDAPEDVEATDRAIARDMATVLDWLAAEQPETVEHPEATCHRCHGPNIAWSAPSPLWNAVMRGGSINGGEDHDGIVCPVCFATLAEALGIADLWMFSAQRVHVDLETVTPSGRVWDETTWLWREPTEQPEQRHESFTKLICGKVDGPHPKHTWSHPDEPCEGHVCPGVPVEQPEDGTQ